MQFREISWQSDEYQQACELRNTILRLPLGLNLLQEDLSNEAEYLHFGMFKSDRLVACVLAVPLGSGRAKLRQMAVSGECQGQGIGRRLIESVEDCLVQQGFQVVELDARREAVGFYEKLGYIPKGDEFISVTIPHQRMTKAIAVE
ncbi:MAG: GNAT family N-acetyltransferase [Gimesia chilikensis]|uniref:GNAT family N-acetyltransferase n=1 Tax=Gimesia chilikensis TaxID=2605989 RepID=UPI00378737B0